jgi:hypothetical protein
VNNKKIAIIGAGLAGLNCARLLEKDYKVTLFEKNAQVGGRILSIKENGYILDHGFQVFLPDYPEAQKAFDYQTLHLKAFTPGALIRIGDKFHQFSDPLRDPQHFFSTLMAPIGNIKDKLLILKLKRAVRSIDPKLKGVSTYCYLKDFGFSDSIVDRFFRPFFSGVFLERNLETSAYFFSFLFALFSNCNATVPKNGMIELPKNLLYQLKKTTLFLNTKITKITSQSIVVNGIEESFAYVVSAFDNHSSQFQVVTTDYFETDKAVALNPTLYLNGTTKGVINHIAPMSLVNPAYGPEGKFLWSVNLLAPNEDASVEIVQNELSEWFKGETFTHLKRFTIKKALPASPLFGQGEILDNGVFQCGDQMQDPSINGALKSGRLVAELILSKK